MKTRTKHASSTLPHRPADWRLFAAAAGASLAAVSNADAAIIYVDPTVKTTAALNTGGKNFSIDGLNIRLTATNGSDQTNCFALQGIPGAAHRFFIAQGGVSYGLAMKFKPGTAIVGNPGIGVELRGRYTFPPYSKVGAFTTGKTGIAGFQLPSSKGGGEGWLRVEVSSINGDGRPDELTAIDWAYNNAGGGISAGQGEPAAAPEPGTKALALLALGSAGVLAWRRRRNEARACDPAALTSPDAARNLCA